MIVQINFFINYEPSFSKNKSKKFKFRISKILDIQQNLEMYLTS